MNIIMSIPGVCENVKIEIEKCIFPYLLLILDDE